MFTGLSHLVSATALASPLPAGATSLASAMTHNYRVLTRRLTHGLMVVATAATLLIQPFIGLGPVQAQETTQPPTIQGLSRQPTQAAFDALLDPNDAVLLLLDHQTGLFQTVNDIDVATLRANTVALAKIAEQAGIPIIYTASEPDGPNGPIMSELIEAAPNATYVARKGEVSSWDNEDFVKAVEATGRKTLIMAGVWTSVCVAFPALQAQADGYKVYAVMDASGDVSKLASDAAMLRMANAGILPVTTNTILSESHRTWNRDDAAIWGSLYGELVHEYYAVAESYGRAQEAANK